MTFEKDRVFTALNADELKQGDKVIGGNTLADLKYKVGIETLDTILDEGETYRFTTKEGEKWLMVLLVERKENCTNCKYSNPHKNLLYCEDDNIPIYVGGEKLSVCDKYASKTEQKAEKNLCDTCKDTYPGCPAFVRDVKFGNGKGNDNVVECKYYDKKKHYRPFKDTDELIKVWLEKRMITYPDLTLPHIWVRLKVNFCKQKGQVITKFDDSYVSVNGDCKTMQALFNDYEFLDGSVCGVEE